MSLFGMYQIGRARDLLVQQGYTVTDPEPKVLTAEEQRIVDRLRERGWTIIGPRADGQPVERVVMWL